jgi:glycosyltransferase involved in cell wall biosynthesis
LIAVSDETKEFMKDRYGIPEELINIIPLGCDTTAFSRDLSARREFRKAHQVNEDDTIFVYAGKLAPWKGIHILVEAAIGLFRENRNAKVMLVGNGPREYVGNIHRRIEASGFRNNFLVLPMVPNRDLSKVYSAGDVGVWPRQCSVTMIEAMACGLPIIISDASGTIERVNHGNGLLYHGEDPIDLREKMKILLNGKTRELMGKKAREFAESHDWRELSRQFLKSAT